MMKPKFFVLLTIGMFLLFLSSLIPSTSTGAHPSLQVTITPTVFNYLPFVAKNWLPPTPHPCPPQLGDWTGQESEKGYPVSFTVTSDCKVRDFYIKVPFGIYSCRITILEDIDIVDGQFAFEWASGLNAISGEFTSSTSASGSYYVAYCAGTLIIPGSEGTWEAYK